jgi:hypothetical protein
MVFEGDVFQEMPGDGGLFCLDLPEAFGGG